MIRRRWIVLGVWIVVFVVSVVASSGLADLLTNRFTLPGTDTARRRGDPRGATSARRRRERSRSSSAATPSSMSKVFPEVRRPQRNVRPTCCRPARSRRSCRSARRSSSRRSPRTSRPADAKGYTDDIRAAVGEIPDAEVFVTGQAAIEHDLDPVFDRRPQGRRALHRDPDRAAHPRLRVRVARVPRPVHLRGRDDPGHARDRLDLRPLHGADDLPPEPGHADRVRDRDRLLAARRLPLPRGAPRRACSKEDAVVQDDGDGRARGGLQRHRRSGSGSRSCSSCRCRSCAASGSAGSLIPVVSIVAAMTLLPVLLYFLRGQARPRAARCRSGSSSAARPRRTSGRELARAIMRRPDRFAVATDGAPASPSPLPALALELGPGSNEGIPQDLESVRGPERHRRRRSARGARADGDRDRHRRGGAACGPEVQERRGSSSDGLDGSTRRSPASTSSRAGRSTSTRPAATSASTWSASTSTAIPAALDFVDRLRDEIIPAAGFPASVAVFAGGGPAGRRRLPRPHLRRLPVARARRAAPHLPPAPAGVPLAAAPAEGDHPEPALDPRRLRAARHLLQVGRRPRRSGSSAFDQIEGWIPVFVFAMVFGLSMDYEVFLV